MIQTETFCTSRKNEAALNLGHLSMSDPIRVQQKRIETDEQSPYTATSYRIDQNPLKTT